MSAEPQSGFRLSAQQRRAWETWQADPRASAVCALEIAGPLDPARMRSAAEALAARHEIFRTTFHRRPGLRFPFQVIGEPGEVSFEASAASGADIEPLARELIEGMVDGFDLMRGPALRVHAASLSPNHHVVAMVLPVLCADARTLRIAACDLARLYEFGKLDEDAPIQYADYAQWQSDLFEARGERAERARTYWRGRIQSASVRLPFESIARDELPGPASFALGAEAVALIRKISAASDVSLFDFLLAAWAALVSRASGEPDITIGALHDGRTLEELENAAGLFATALPVSLHVDEASRFDELVRQVAEARRRNAEWEEYFGEPDASETSARAGQTGFSFRESQEPWVEGDLRFSILFESSPVERFPLALSASTEGAGLRLVVESDLPSGGVGAAQRLASHLAPLLAAAAVNPRALVFELPLFEPAERRRLLLDWNKTRAEIPRASVHELFQEQAARHPDSPAVASGTRRLTYRELNERANALAWRLSEKGAAPGTRIGLAIDRSVDAIVALLAVLKSGAAYVPLNPDFPPARLAQQLAQSGATLAITQSRWLPKLEGFGRKTLLYEGALSEARDPRNPPRAVGPDDLAYVMSTSGSTGVPKAVGSRHESLTNYTHFIVSTLLGRDARASEPLSFATVSTLNADLGNTAIFPSLVSGGLLHVVPYEAAMEGGAFAAYASAHPIDVLKIVPSHFAALLSSGGGSTSLPRRCLLLGGEALSWELVDRIRSLGATCEIVNHYGPTETTVGSLVYRIGERERPSSATVPIGRPIANTEAYVLDGGREPVPVGVTGELYIGGVGLARGYEGQAGETAERFVPHPFLSAPGARLYRTGDLTRYLPGGDVEFLGRVDDQVKIRGFRIEPNEVRATLVAHASVRDAVVVAREDSPGERRLVAYVVPSRGARFSAEELRATLRRELPDYMMPSAFVPLKSFPLTANGKLDRGRLPAPEGARGERPYVEPRNDTERVMATIWAEVLKVERVGVDDDFFELGGHSLLITQIVARMRRALARDFPIRWVFESPTISALAGRAEAAEREDLSRILDELERGPEARSEKLEVRHEPPVGA